MTIAERFRKVGTQEGLLFLLVLASRLPFLDAGFGTDPDAWRVASTSATLRATGEYIASRFPGFPLFELLVSALIPFGPSAINGLIALFSAVAAVFMLLLLRRCGAGRPFLGACVFACTPIVWANSTVTMDYLPAVTLVLASFLSAMKGRSLTAGILLGLAAGFRVTSLAALIPFLLFFVLDHDGAIMRRSLSRFIGAAMGVAILAYALPIVNYGLSLFSFREVTSASVVDLIRLVTLDVWGLVGAVGLLVSIGATLLLRRHHAPLTPDNRTIVIASSVGVVVFLLLFFRLPAEPEYLIPAIPFTIVLASVLLPDRVFLIFAASALLSSAIGGVDAVDRPWSVQPSETAVRISLGGRDLVVEPFRGPVLLEHCQRLVRLEYVREILAWSNARESPTCIVAGSWFPQFVVTAGGTLGEDFEDDADLIIVKTHIVSTLSRDGGAGRFTPETRIFFIPGQEKTNRVATGLDLSAVGARPLSLKTPD